MKMNSFVGLVVSSMLLVPTLPQSAATVINWNELNLTRKQSEEIQIIDAKWQNYNALIRPKLIKDQEQLKVMLANPCVPDCQIRELQKQIFISQEQLRYQALENFLAKRRLLNKEQKLRLHKMLSH